MTADGRTLRQSYDALLDILFPDGTLPNVGDAYGRRAVPGQYPDYERLFARFGDPRYAWVLQQHGTRSETALSLKSMRRAWCDGSLARRGLRRSIEPRQGMPRRRMCGSSQPRWTGMKRW